MHLNGTCKDKFKNDVKKLYFHDKAWHAFTTFFVYSASNRATME